MIIIPNLEFSIFTIFFSVFIFFLLLQFFYVTFIHAKFAFFQEITTDSSHTLLPISIIIAARNESDNLYENLPAILTQDYPEFEVIVVNNQSIDDSGWLLTAFSRQYANLRIVELGRNRHLRPGKKFPITLGVKAAKYEHLLFTDADCKPSSNQWIRQMSSGFLTTKQIVIGYGPYFKEKGFLNRLIRFDTAWITWVLGVI